MATFIFLYTDHIEFSLILSPLRGHKYKHVPLVFVSQRLTSGHLIEFVCDLLQYYIPLLLQRKSNLQSSLGLNADNLPLMASEMLIDFCPIAMSCAQCHFDNRGREVCCRTGLTHEIHTHFRIHFSS